MVGITFTRRNVINTSFPDVARRRRKGQEMSGNLAWGPARTWESKRRSGRVRGVRHGLDQTLGQHFVDREIDERSHRPRQLPVTEIDEVQADAIDAVAWQHFPQLS